jgi:hypothetical protein
MYCFKICNRIKLVCVLKFVVYKINFEMVKSEIMVLIRREKTDMNDVDVPVRWMMQPTTGALLNE